MSAEVDLISTMGEKKTWTKPPIQMEFQVWSAITVQSLAVILLIWDCIIFCIDSLLLHPFIKPGIWIIFFFSIASLHIYHSCIYLAECVACGKFKIWIRNFVCCFKWFDVHTMVQDALPLGAFMQKRTYSLCFCACILNVHTKVCTSYMNRDF